MISINFNPSVLKTQNSLNIATSALNKSLLRMSTGYKINSASDDAAGLFIASGLSSQISGLRQAQSNVSTGLSYLDIAEGTLGNMTNILNRLRDLAVQGSNSTYDTSARTAMQNEADALIAELSRVKDSADFNGINVFNGNAVEATSGIVDSVPTGYIGIYTVDDLKNITNGLGGNYILMNDIDLSGIEDWTPIGRNSSFTGTFDGNGHIIKNMTTTGANCYYAGLFGYMTSSATIKNLGLENVNINVTYGDTYYYTGGIVGYSSSGTIENCYVTGSIKTQNQYVGGIVGYSSGTIENCYVDCTITATRSGSMTGGIVGYAGSGKIQNCYSKGSINGNLTSSDVGGIVGGASSGRYTVQYVFSLMELSGTRVGGICGLSGNLNSNYYSVYNSDLVNTGIGALSGVTDSSVGITTKEFEDASNFRGWDTDIWDFSGKLPMLKNMPHATGTTNNVRFQIGADSDEATNAIYIDTALNLDIHEFNFTSVENCNAVIEKIDLMLAEINKKTSLIGVTYNRLESVMDSQNTQLENYTSALSTIMDADIAEESANYVKAQILQQTTSSLLSQAQSIQASVILNIIGSLG